MVMTLTLQLATRGGAVLRFELGENFPGKL